MFINEMELRVRYEMKKEELQLAMLAGGFKKNSKQKMSNTPKTQCCDIQIQKVYC